MLFPPNLEGRLRADDAPYVGETQANAIEAKGIIYTKAVSIKHRITLDRLDIYLARSQCRHDGISRTKRL